MLFKKGDARENPHPKVWKAVSRGCWFESYRPRFYCRCENGGCINMMDKIIALLEVRKLIALLIVLLFVTLSLWGVLEVNFIQTVIISVISFYFGKTSTIIENSDKKQ